MREVQNPFKNEIWKPESDAKIFAEIFPGNDFREEKVFPKRPVTMLFKHINFTIFSHFALIY